MPVVCFARIGYILFGCNEGKCSRISKDEHLFDLNKSDLISPMDAFVTLIVALMSYMLFSASGKNCGKTKQMRPKRN